MYYKILKITIIKTHIIVRKQRIAIINAHNNYWIYSNWSSIYHHFRTSNWHCHLEVVYSWRVSLTAGSLGLGQTKNIKISICCFCAKHATFRGKSKAWSSQIQFNIPWLSSMSSCCCWKSCLFWSNKYILYKARFINCMNELFLNLHEIFADRC